ncbi:MAG: DUF481 domain-containing protein [Cyanobacterium sp. T60_A2020_053]|nr:DUF481 domain-containing protein [Cyanobacterium sp. T60_A2020_053]
MIVNLLFWHFFALPLQAQTNDKLFLLNQSLVVIRALDNPLIKAQMLANLTKQYYQQNELAIVKELLKESWEISEQIKQKPEQILHKLSIINLYIEYEEKTSALHHLPILKSAIDKLEDYSLKTAFLMDIANKYEQLGETQQAQIIREEVEISIVKANQPKPSPPPKFPFQEQPLKGKIRLANNSFIADRNLINFNFNSTFSKQWPRNKLNLNLKLWNNYDSSRRIDRQNRFVIDIVSEYQHYWREKFYSFANFGYLQDDFSSVEDRVSFFTGVGFNVWTGSQKHQKLDMQLGIGDLFQNSTLRNKQAPFPVFQYSLNYENLMFTDWKFNQQLTLEIPATNTANYYIDTISKINIPTFEKWSIFGSINFKYISITESNKPNLERRFMFGLEYEL